MTLQHRSRRKAAKARLKFVNDFDGRYSRRRCGRGFTYVGVNGQTLRGERTRGRIESLTIPPAWEDVWICPTEDGHIQARGRDEAGRLQYIYHSDWQTISSAKKFDRMSRFAEVLPRVRRRVRKDMSQDGLPRERVLAAIIRLLDKAQLRIGSDDAETARGATALTADHFDIDEFRVSLDFPGKSGRRREVTFSDRKLVSVIQHCEELDGQFLFSYTRNDGKAQSVSSTAVNGYLQEIANEQVTAKDFRTWAGSAVALSVLADFDEDTSEREHARKTACRDAVKAAADTLGNTVAVCRKSYVHPGILAAGHSGELREMLSKLPGKDVSEMTIDDARLREILPQLDFA